MYAKKQNRDVRDGSVNSDRVYSDRGITSRDEHDIFTYRDKTEKRFSVKQAYSQAASVIRVRLGLDEQAQVFGPGAYHGNGDEKTLTMLEMSRMVTQLVQQSTGAAY